MRGFSEGSQRALILNESRSGYVVAIPETIAERELMRAIDLNKRLTARPADNQQRRCLSKNDSEGTGQWDYQNRQYRHALNAHSGIDSICLRCQQVVGSAGDEWLLLDYEKRHACSMASPLQKKHHSHEKQTR